MPTVESNKSRYIIPSDLDPDGICCISVPVPDDPQWRAQFLGALWRLTLQTHYERDAAKSGKTVAARWRTVYEEVRDSMSQCQRPNIISNTAINTTLRLAMRLEFVANGLDGIAPDRPDTFFDEDSGDVGDEVQQRENALCLACIDYVNTIAQDIWDLALGTGLTVAITSTPILFAINPIAAAIAVLVLAVLTQEILDAAENENTREAVACCMYNNLRGQAVTEANFLASLTGCGFAPLSGEEVAREAVEMTLGDSGNWLAFVAQLGGFFAASGDAALDCPCNVIELEINPAREFTEEMTLTYLGDNRWECTAGVWDHPTAGPTGIADVVRVGGGCFTTENCALISGAVTRTSWVDCGGGSGFTDNPAPLPKNNKEDYYVQRVSSVAGFVIRFDAVPV